MELRRVLLYPLIAISIVATDYNLIAESCLEYYQTCEESYYIYYIISIMKHLNRLFIKKYPVTKYSTDDILSTYTLNEGTIFFQIKFSSQTYMRILLESLELCLVFVSLQ